MALNYQQVFEKIREIASGAGVRRKTTEALRQRTHALLEDWAGRTEELRSKVDRARQADPGLRCAIPLDERLDASHPAPGLPEHRTLLAADGSQILPDRHAALYYSLVNVGVIALELGSGRAPEVFTDSRLLFDDELYTKTGLKSEEAIQQQRDIVERQKLLELSAQFTPPVVALTDGPVELWGAKGGEADEYRHNLETHKSLLSQLQGRGVTVAGYVDKPSADLVVRLLEVATLADDQMKDIRTLHPLRGVTDRWLFGNLLEPGQRSAVFALQSSSRSYYTGDLALHFFYLNVGSVNHPSLVRVEIPAWVAQDDQGLDLLHAALLDQCRLMGARPYPYLLHRAHEIAVVGFDEKEQLEQMLAIELRKAGGEVDEKSSKQSAKDLPGKSKHK